MTMKYMLVDVPVTLTVKVRADSLDAATAIEAAQRYALTLEPSEMETAGYSDEAFVGRSDGLGIVRAYVEPDDRRECKAVPSALD